MREIVIPQLMTTVVKGMTDQTACSNYLSVVVEPVIGYSGHIAMARSYGELRPGKGKIDVCLRNYSVRQVTLPKQTTLGGITLANMIPVLLDQKPTGLEEDKKKTTIKKKMKVRKNY